MSEARESRRTHPPPLPLTDDRAWSFAEVAYFLNVSESTVRNLERDGSLPALPRIGRRVIFDPRVIRAFREGWRPSKGRQPESPPAVQGGPRRY
ncbi:MAG: helix-turn-helix domain-containing protein [Deltaproteobacteria bacterium]|nr:helix-turn-helix domain-containing protein [Deltaproteobacteria bacterium]